MSFSNYNLKSIQIFKLFGKYTTKIDLKSKCNILVGANGVGKSTILKIILGVLHGDFVEVSKYDFSSVELEYEDIVELVKIKRIELFPNLKWVKSRIEIYLKDCYIDVYDDDSTDIANLNSVIAVYKKYLARLDAENLYCDFITNIKNNKQHSFYLKQIIDDANQKIAPFRFYPTVESTFDEIIKTRNHIGKGKDNTRNYYKNSLVDKEMNNETHIFSVSNAILINLVNNYNFDNSIISNPRLESHMLNSISGLCKIKQKTFADIYNMKIYPQRYVGINDDIFHTTDGKVVDFIKSLLINIDDISFEDEYIASIDYFSNKEKWHYKPYGFFIESIINDNKVRINELINRYYYEKSFVVDFNKRMLKSCADIVGNKEERLSKSEKARLKKFFENPKVQHYINNYFIPITISNTIFDEVLDKIKSGLVMEELDIRYAKFYEFYSIEKDVLIDKANRNSKLVAFEESLKEYMNIKKIEIYPSGLFLRDINCESKKTRNFELLTSKESFIDLSVLSSGEKKIILMHSLAIFTDNIHILFDEPELSLSLIWQEQLIPSLLKNAGNKKLMIATHSPYIASDDSLTPYMKYLPTEKE